MDHQIRTAQAVAQSLKESLERYDSSSSVRTAFKNHAGSLVKVDSIYSCAVKPKQQHGLLNPKGLMLVMTFELDKPVEVGLDRPVQ